MTPIRNRWTPGVSICENQQWLIYCFRPKKQNLNLTMRKHQRNLGWEIFYKITSFWTCKSLSCVDSLQPHGLCSLGSSVLGDSPGKNTGVGCHFLLQGIFLTQGLNPGLPHCRRIRWATLVFKKYLSWETKKVLICNKGKETKKCITAIAKCKTGRVEYYK